MYLDSQQILAVYQVVGDIEGVGAVGVLRVTHLVAVDVDIVGGLYTLEVDVDATIGVGETLVHGEGLTVHAHRVVVHRCQGGGGAGSGVTALPGHLGVGVDGVVEAEIGPAGGELKIRLPLHLVLRCDFTELEVGIHDGAADVVIQRIEILICVGLRHGVVLHHGERPVGLVRSREELDVLGGVLLEVHGTNDGVLHTVVDHGGGGEATGVLVVDAKDILIVDGTDRLACPLHVSELGLTHIGVCRSGEGWSETQIPGVCVAGV